MVGQDEKIGKEQTVSEDIEEETIQRRNASVKKRRQGFHACSSSPTVFRSQVINRSIQRPCLPSYKPELPGRAGRAPIPEEEAEVVEGISDVVPSTSLQGHSLSINKHK